ncbi:tellurite resistance/C4-dicarboxylate transporter family protein [Streptomyces sp. NBC_00582]|uniref:tellurite resistance/C4-dicarboxylate transporter family protein n=1 Tax=Streptomyces sp. NBC_00582 TaxID=2975783 RepID=UPI0010638EFC|nr:tellurite resistance/C4-dicarboxylate transporter family protein [Streptomyces sp. NBC_00582]WUB62410.1 tellurite resistance/C4-dicarboxylate transporter family protein [Streptomyces sp. NBC_00582]
MSGSSSLRAWWARRPPAAGAVVLATGILSVGLRLAGHEVLFQATLALAGAAWALLASDFVVRLVREPRRWRAEAGTPGGLTAVAATTVLGAGVSALGRQNLAWALLALAAVLWPLLMTDVVRHVTRHLMSHRGRRMHGDVFLCCVATQGLAVLGATLAKAERLDWPAHTALVLFWLGLLLYVFMLALFDWREVTDGAGDQWVAGGALAVSALAGARLTDADHRLHLWNADDRGVLRGMTLALLVLALCWYAVLLAGELLRPRLRYDVRRWATVFPMGMTAVAMLSAAPALVLPRWKGPGEALLWVAVAAWLAVAVAALAAGPLGSVTSRGPR